MMEDAIMKFYRYEEVTYAIVGINGDFESPKFPNPKLELHTFVLWKETPKGYRIGYGPPTTHGWNKWFSKSKRFQYAYKTKKEALESYIKRTEYKVSIYKKRILSYKLALAQADTELLKINNENI